jgi:3-oxoacyl-[acyl-carrier protein] reductase
VVGGDTGSGADLAAGLEDLGASVASLAVEHLSGRGEVASHFVTAAQKLGALDGVVIASVSPSAPRRGVLVDLDRDEWRQRVELPLHRTLLCFQGALRSLRDVGGTVVLLVPTLSLVGADGSVPWATVTEGQRALAKAAARAWGPLGITVNCVAVPAALLADASPGVAGADGAARDGAEDEDRFDRSGQPRFALDAPGMRTDVAAVVHALCTPAWRAVTGATVAVDGGVWMNP